MYQKQDVFFDFSTLIVHRAINNGITKRNKNQHININIVTIKVCMIKSNQLYRNHRHIFIANTSHTHSEYLEWDSDEGNIVTC